MPRWMARVVMAVAMVAMGAGVALAEDASAVGGKLDRLEEGPSDAGSGQLHLPRYAFNVKGPRADRVAARRCGNGVADVHTHHTFGDVTAAFFTMGWYTPEHASFSCAPTANR